MLWVLFCLKFINKILNKLQSQFNKIVWYTGWAFILVIMLTSYISQPATINPIEELPKSYAIILFWIFMVLGFWKGIKDFFGMFRVFRRR